MLCGGDRILGEEVSVKTFTIKTVFSIFQIHHGADESGFLMKPKLEMWQR